MSQELQAAAGDMRQEVFVLNANDERDIEAAFGALVEREQMRHLSLDPSLFGRRDRLVALASRHAVPAIYEWREFAEAGGLMSEGASVADAYRLVGVYAGKILSGSNPADLPVQSTKVELRVGEDVATLTPHRPGRAGLPHPVLHGRAPLCPRRLECRGIRPPWVYTCCDEGYPDGPGRASNKEGES